MKMNLNNKLRKILIGIFFLSIMIMFYLVFTPHFPISLNLGSSLKPDVVLGRAPIIFVPFKEIFDVGFWLNIIMTMPIGGIILLIKNDIMKFRIICLFGLFVGLFIETTQFILDNAVSYFLRFVDINDVISNMMGIILGFYLLMGCIKLINRLIECKNS